MVAHSGHLSHNLATTQQLHNHTQQLHNNNTTTPQPQHNRQSIAPVVKINNARVCKMYFTATGLRLERMRSATLGWRTLTTTTLNCRRHCNNQPHHHRNRRHHRHHHRQYRLYPPASSRSKCGLSVPSSSGRLPSRRIPNLSFLTSFWRASLSGAADASAV